jgi:serine/threonine protein kinase
VLALFEDPSKKKTICVKTFDEELRDNPAQRTRFMNEVEMLWHLKHPCVVSLAGFGLAGRRSAGQIGTEFAVRGSLGSGILGRNVLSGTEIGIVVSGIVIGMRFIHSRGVIHRRLNLENILLDDVGHIRITGFDWSRFTDVDPIGAEPPVSVFTAPEMYEGGKSTSAVDIFAFGLILYELIVGEPVFAATLSPEEVKAKVVGGERPKMPESVNETVRKVIKRSWSCDADVRPSFDEILFAFDRIKFRLIGNVDVDRVYEFISTVTASSSS